MEEMLTYIDAPCLTPQFMLFTLPSHLIVIFAHFTVVYFFYFVYEKIKPFIKVAIGKIFNNTGNPSASGGFDPLDPPTRDLPWTRWGLFAVPRPPPEIPPPPPTKKKILDPPLDDANEN